MTDISTHSRASFVTYLPMQTRWADNDIYGHVNNVTYFSYFDTAVNQWLIAQGLLSLHTTDETQPLGLVVDNRCQFYRSIAFPEQLEVGLRVEHVGNSSVRFGLGIFQTEQDQIAAYGQFTHVYVNRVTRKPMPLPPLWRSQLLTLYIEL